MLLLPLGVEAKTVDVPWATIVIVCFTTFYSVLNMGVSQNYIEALLEFPERRAYQQQLKTFLAAECPGYLDADTCRRFDERVGAHHLFDADTVAGEVGYTRRSSAEYKRLVAFLEPFLDADKVARMKLDAPGFAAVKDRLNLLRERMKTHLAKEDLFSGLNRGAWALVRAQFLHGGYFHLFGNLLLLLLLAVPVEQRLGTWFFSGVYLLSGFAGLYAQSLIGEGAYIVGASACVFGVAGAFLALFARSKMRVWVTSIVSHRIVTMPVLMYFAVWIVAEQVLGLGESTNVAHLAHLVGLGTGFVIAFGIVQFAPLPEGLVYPYEKDLLMRARGEKDAARRFAIFRHWLQLNPVSRHAAVGAFGEFHRLRKDVGLSDQQTAMGRAIFWPSFEEHLNRDEILRELPLDWLTQLPSGFDREKIGRALKKAHDEKRAIGEWILLLPLLADNHHVVAPQVAERFGVLSEKVQGDPDFVERLQELGALAPEFRDRLEARGLWMGIVRSDYAG